MDPLTLALLGGTALASGGLGFLGSQNASKAQSEAAANQLAFQKQVYAQQQADLSPYKRAGAGALDRISGLYGLGLGGHGGNGLQDFSSFYNSPDYQFAFQQGRSALENSAAARGGLLGGNFARGATEYGQGYANNYLQNYINRLMGVSQLGQSSALGGGQLAGNMSNQIAGSYGNQGAANASGIVGGTNAITGALSGGVQNYLTLQGLNNQSSYIDAIKNRQPPYSPNYGVQPMAEYY